MVKRLSLDNMPQPKRAQNIKKLGLVNRAKTKKVSYRFRQESIEMLKDLKRKVDKKANIEISESKILQILIIEALKNPAHVISLINV